MNFKLQYCNNGTGDSGFVDFGTLWDGRTKKIKTTSQLVRHLDLDILGIGETHLLKDQILSVDGFTWFGNNRKGLHRKAKTGSRGVGFLVKNDIFRAYDVTVDFTEGIFWLKSESQNSSNSFFMCVCY